MAFDGFLTRGMVLELSKNLVGGRIEKIYNPEKNDIVIYIGKNKIKYKLFASVDTNHGGIYLSDEKFENPPSPSAFCMLLRKHLLNGRILDISQKNWDRIVEISVESRSEMDFAVEKKLIVEIMNKHSNIVLVDSSTGKILDAVKRISLDASRVRQVIPGLVYSYPPEQKKMLPEEFANLSGEDFLKLRFKDSKDILNNISGISPIISRELFNCISPVKLMRDFIDEVSSCDFSKKVYMKDDKLFDFHILPFNEYRGLSSKEFSTISEAVCYFYSGRKSSNRVRQKSTDLKKHVNNMLKKLSLKQDRLLTDLSNAERYSKYQIQGELLTANLHMVKKGDNSVNVTNYYTGEPMEIKLDKMLSPAQNAQKLYKKYNKSKIALVEKKVQLDLTRKDIAYLRSTLDFIDMADAVSNLDVIRDELISQGFIKRRPKMPKLKKSNNPRKSLLSYTSPSGFSILVGKNNTENDIITTKIADNRDIWLHTKDIHGSHVILETKGAEYTDEDILTAAELAAFYSKARNSEKVPVDYTMVKYVKKPNGAKPGMVIFTHNKTLYVTGKNRF